MSLEASTETILAQEDRLDRALRDSDVAALEGLLADDLVFTGHRGHVLTKRDELAMHASGSLVFRGVSPSERVLRLLPGAAVVGLRLDLAGTHGGLAFAGAFRFTRVWCVRDGRWQVIAVHASRMPAPIGRTA